MFDADLIKQDKVVLLPLAGKVRELANLPEQNTKRELWANHNSLKETGKIPVCVTYEGIPEQQWDLIFGQNHLKCVSETARTIEFDLKKRIWMAENVPDDHIVWPFATVNAVIGKSMDWGVKLEWEKPVEELGSMKIIAPFSKGINISLLTVPELIVDEKATDNLVEYARELLEGMLDIFPVYPDTGYSPFEVAVQMRGMEGLLFDVYDNPRELDALMEFITNAFILINKKREEKGWINYIKDNSGKYLMPLVWRVNCSYVNSGFKNRRAALSDEWAYVSAQSASGFSPAAYEKFVHRYDYRLAELFTEKTVYYHGCECLDQKLDVLGTLPNLRRFHVSPWSSVHKVAQKFKGGVVLEVHSHPGKVFFTFRTEDMKKEIQEFVSASLGCTIDLNLSDIYSLNGNPQTMKVWAETAQEIAWKNSAWIIK